MMVTDIKEALTLRGTELLGKILNAWRTGKRGIWLEGGTESSKTWSALQFLKLTGENYPERLHMSVMSETMPHLKQGAILDFKDIMGDDFNDSWWNKSDFIYTWPNTGSWLHFFSADMPSKVKGPRRDVLFVNEANHIEKETFRQADWRTRLFTIADWNPESSFWFHEDNLSDDSSREYVHTTYLDALEVMTTEKRRELESWEEKDPNFWQIYGLGLLGKIEGLVHPQPTDISRQVDELPTGEVFYGLDYGFSQDPTVLVKNVVTGENLYSQEMFYDATGLTNDDIARKMSLCGVKANELIEADRDEPKSAEELSRLGFNVLAIDKAFANPAFGIKKVNSYKQHWTKDSLNCIKEQRNFRYIKDRQTGEFTDKTTHRWSHGMSARRFALSPHIDQVAGGRKGILVVGW